MMKTAIYLRVSTKDKQDITKQRDFLIRFVQNNPALNLFKVYQDRGISGSKQSRPGLDELMSELDQFDAVLVYKLDRIGRSFIHLFDLMEVFKRKNIQFISATQDINTTTPEGKLYFNMLGSFAEFERDIIKQRINDGLTEAKRRGIKLGRPKGSKDRKKRRVIGYLQRWEDQRHDPV